MRLWRIERGENTANLVPHVVVHPVWYVLQPLAVEFLTADIVVANP